MLIFVIIWVSFIYLLIVYRTFYKKGRRYFKENLGLLVISIIITLSLQDNSYFKAIVIIVSIGLIIMTLIKWISNKDNK